jgi:hypothetical protein
MRRRIRIKCAHCGKRVKAHEPDLVLRDLDDNGGRDRYFHTACGGRVGRVAAQKPSAYVLTVRHVEGALN